MRKATTKRATTPSRASLGALPEIDFATLRARRNPYAARILREGSEVIHDSPSPQSLTEIPEVSFDAARPSPYAARLAAELRRVRAGRGRPRAGEEVGPTSTRSIRFTAATWQALEAEAARTGSSVHAVLRQVVLRHLQQREPAIVAARPRKKR